MGVVSQADLQDRLRQAEHQRDNLAKALREIAYPKFRTIEDAVGHHSNAAEEIARDALVLLEQAAFEEHSC